MTNHSFLTNFQLLCHPLRHEFTKIPLLVVAQGHKGVTETRRLWVQSLLDGMNYYFLVFSSSLWHQDKIPALRSTTQPARPRKVWRKVENEVSYYYVPSAYPAVCGIYACKLKFVNFYKLYFPLTHTILKMTRKPRSNSHLTGFFF